MKLFLVALLVVMSSSAVAQVPQNPEACALLRADLDEAYNRFITSGLPPDVAIALVERMLEMRRKTGDPCYWPPPAPGCLLGITWVGLSPTDRASFAWRLRRVGPTGEISASVMLESIRLVRPRSL